MQITRIHNAVAALLMITCAAQGVARSRDCRDWGKSKFFERATAADVRACLDAGADSNARTGKWTPLHRAVVNSKDPAVIQVLVDAGAHLEARGDGMLGGGDLTPLHRAVEWAAPDIVQALVDAGAPLEARNQWGMTPLHCALGAPFSPEKVAILLAAGADPNAQTNKGKRPLGMVKRKKEKQLLLAAGATTSNSGGSGSGLGALIAGAALGATAAAYGASAEDAAESGTVFAEQVRAGQAAARTGSNVGSGGSCMIPGYPRPSGGVANVSLPWCPASVSMQVRAFALQAAGAQCAIAMGSSSTAEQIQVRQREIEAACSRLAVLNVSNCRCPASLRR